MLPDKTDWKIINLLSKKYLPNITVAKKLGLYGDESTKKIHEFAWNLLGRNIFSSRSKIDIEALFTLIEIEIERNPAPELLLIRQELLKLIQAILMGLSGFLKRKTSIQGHRLSMEKPPVREWAPG